MSDSTPKKIANKPRIHVTTLGCSKNLYDSEILMGQFKANEVPLTSDPEEADVIIVNTCGFITPAKQESIQAILEAGEIKKKRPGTKLLVCGCLSKRYYADLKLEIPEVDEYFGTEDFQNILSYLNLPVPAPEFLYENRYLSQQQHFAYLKIAEGCNHKCAFCAIPLMRGSYRSRRLEEIVEEARLLSEQGVKELILIAQDTTFYGLDRYKKQRLIELLEALEPLPGIEWIRLHYAYPTTIQDELIERIADSEKIVKYIDLPLQHVTDRMLKIMKRGGNSRRIRQILERIRHRIPEVAIRTAFIVGHPGETEEDFEALKRFVQEFEFDRLGVFVYSPEENTSAYELPHPEPEIAEERYRELMSLQREISLRKNLAKIGKTYPVLIDEVNSEENSAFGRTYADSPEIDNEVIFENVPANLTPGQFVPAQIVDAGEYELFAQIVEEK